jgi:hypothetical protein
MTRSAVTARTAPAAIESSVARVATSFFGGGGNARLEARDGFFDVIDCGPGRDTVVADRNDRVRPGCEVVRRG